MSGRKIATRGEGSRRGRWLTLLVLTVFAVGVVVIIIAVATQQRATTPSAGAWGTVPTDSGSPAAPASSAQPSQPATAAAGATAPDSSAGKSKQGKPGQGQAGQAGSATSSPRSGLPASVPVKIKIPAIHVDSAVFPIGKDSHGGLQVPQPGPNLNNVAWYKDSPTPGQTGPAVLEGHVDTVQGPSVFLHLGALTPGDTIKISRADGIVAVFTVDAVRDYKSHSDFPTDLVYSGDLSSPTLRIITCSNFDDSIGHYVGNTIVFAHLASSHHG